MKFPVQYSYLSSQKILTEEALIRKAQAWRFAREKKIVFTNGCFDLLHLGHVDYLEKASRLGDYLIVALNSDASVRELKGENRPIIAESARARIIAALEFVDAVTIFDESTPERLIRAILPDILVKGSDYAPEKVVGAEFVKQNGGELALIPFLEGYSTTSIIEKIKKISP
jgi:rfaE bifunctional protein nucleotidyltransferase chain/domain